MSDKDKECNCWDGYCRVPGTEPCAPGSCEKCDKGREAARIFAADDDNLVPPKGVQDAAQRAADWISDGLAGDGMENSTKQQCRDLANGEKVSKEWIGKAHRFFSRHEKNKGEASDPTPGRVAWDAWGGDAGKSWVDSEWEKMEKDSALEIQWHCDDCNSNFWERQQEGATPNCPTCGSYNVEDMADREVPDEDPYLDAFSALGWTGEKFSDSL